MSKYVIRNCPCRMELHKDDCFGHTGYNNCCACTSCVMKQIVELCKGSIRENEHDIYRAGRMSLAVNILGKLDIQEVE